MAASNSSGGSAGGGGGSKRSWSDFHSERSKGIEAPPLEEPLGGYIFVCNNDTMDDDIKRNLFGLPNKYSDSVRAIEPGMPLFLYNYSRHQLHGIYEASSKGGYELDRDTRDARNGWLPSRFPSQVRVRLREQRPPLDAPMFRDCLYHYDGPKFRLELSELQAARLLKLFGRPVESKKNNPEPEPDGVEDDGEWEKVKPKSKGVRNAGVTNHRVGGNARRASSPGHWLGNAGRIMGNGIGGSNADRIHTVGDARAKGREDRNRNDGGAPRWRPPSESWVAPSSGNDTLDPGGKGAVEGRLVVGNGVVSALADDRHTQNGEVPNGLAAGNGAVDANHVTNGVKDSAGASSASSSSGFVGDSTGPTSPAATDSTDAPESAAASACLSGTKLWGGTIQSRSRPASFAAILRGTQSDLDGVLDSLTNGGTLLDSEGSMSKEIGHTPSLAGKLASSKSAPVGVTERGSKDVSSLTDEGSAAASAAADKTAGAGAGGHAVVVAGPNHANGLPAGKPETRTSLNATRHTENGVQGLGAGHEPEKHSAWVKRVARPVPGGHVAGPEPRQGKSVAQGPPAGAASASMGQPGAIANIQTRNMRMADETTKESSKGTLADPSPAEAAVMKVRVGNDAAQHVPPQTVRRPAWQGNDAAILRRLAASSTQSPAPSMASPQPSGHAAELHRAHVRPEKTPAAEPPLAAHVQPSVIQEARVADSDMSAGWPVPLPPPRPRSPMGTLTIDTTAPAAPAVAVRAPSSLQEGHLDKPSQGAKTEMPAEATSPVLAQSPGTPEILGEGPAPGSASGGASSGLSRHQAKHQPSAGRHVTDQLPTPQPPAPPQPLPQQQQQHRFERTSARTQQAAPARHEHITILPQLPMHLHPLPLSAAHAPPFRTSTPPLAHGTVAPLSPRQHALYPYPQPRSPQEQRGHRIRQVSDPGSPIYRGAARLSSEGGNSFGSAQGSGQTQSLPGSGLVAPLTGLQPILLPSVGYPAFPMPAPALLANAPGLHLEVKDYTELARPSREARIRAESAVDCIRGVVRQLWPGADVEVFGSFATGLALPHSDVDVAVVDAPPPPNTAETQALQGARISAPLIRELAAQLQKQDWCEGMYTIETARIPVIKLRCQPKAATALKHGDNIASPASGASGSHTSAGGAPLGSQAILAPVAMDITIAGCRQSALDGREGLGREWVAKLEAAAQAHNGEAAREFVKNKLQLLPALAPLVLLLKTWLQHRGLNDVYTGGLGSFALTLMLVFYLERAPVPVGTPSMHFQSYGVPTTMPAARTPAVPGEVEGGSRTTLAGSAAAGSDAGIRTSHLADAKVSRPTAAAGRSDSNSVEASKSAAEEAASTAGRSTVDLDITSQISRDGVGDARTPRPAASDGTAEDAQQHPGHRQYQGEAAVLDREGNASSAAHDVHALVAGRAQDEVARPSLDFTPGGSASASLSPAGTPGRQARGSGHLLARTVQEDRGGVLTTPMTGGGPSPGEGDMGRIRGSRGTRTSGRKSIVEELPESIRSVPSPSFGVLLAGFLQAFGQEFEFARVRLVLKGRSGHMHGVFLHDPSQRPTALWIDDPLRPGANIGAGSFGIWHVQAAMRDLLGAITRPRPFPHPLLADIPPVTTGSLGNGHDTVDRRPLPLLDEAFDSVMTPAQPPRAISAS